MIENKNPKISNIIIFLTSLLTFFLLWVFYSGYIKDLYVKNVLKTDIRDTSYDNNLNLFNWQDLDLTRFWEVYDLIKKDYYSLEWIKKQDLVDWAIAWMVDAIWDKHSEFFNTKETKMFNEALNWDFEWIGAVVEKTAIWIKVDRLIKGSPAIKSWLLKDDIIIESNGENLVDLDLYDAVDKIKWPAWTKALLKVLRVWENDILEIEVTREKIQIPSVESRIFEEENIWYISLNMFWNNSSEEFKQALNELKNTDGLIIDLRDNWGWYLQSAVEILSEFIENWKTIVSTRYKNSFMNIDYESVHFWDIYDGKLVVLINGNSASASEITAWALRDYDKAIIVWEKSYGKWSVQEPFELEDWSMVKLTIAKWFTPNWVNIDEQWITPDIEVKFQKQDYDLEACKEAWVCENNMKQDDFKFYDRQLERAKEVIKDFINYFDLDKAVEVYNEKYKIETLSWAVNTWSLEE